MKTAQAHSERRVGNRLQILYADHNSLLTDVLTDVFTTAT